MFYFDSVKVVKNGDIRKYFSLYFLKKCSTKN